MVPVLHAKNNPILPLKCFTNLSFCLLSFAPFASLQASNYSFCRFIQLDGSFYIKQDNYSVHMTRMYPGRHDNQMVVNDILNLGPVKQLYLIRWYHAPPIYFYRAIDSDDLKQDLCYDPKNVFVFTGKGITFSTQFLFSTDLLRLRIGLGAGVRCSLLRKMIGMFSNNSQPTNEEEPKNHLYIPRRPYYFTYTPLFQIGFKFIENENYTFLIDSTWATSIYIFSKLGKKYYQYYFYLRTFDLGTTLEKPFLESLHCHFRLAYGLSLYNEVFEKESPLDPHDLLSVSHCISSIIFQAGIGIRIPIRGKCSIMGCHTTLDHKHGGKDYRGKIRFRR